MMCISSISRPNGCQEGMKTSSLSSDVYPDLIAAGETVRTLRNPAVLLAYNWRADHPRCAKVQRFVSALNDSFPKLLNGSYEPKWQEVDMKANVKYLERWDKDC